MRDSVALAELAHLLHEGEAQPAWFEASLAGDAIERIEPLVPIAADLRAVAAGGAHKTPLEFFDAVLVRGGVSRSVLRWGWPDDRLLNLEQLRSLVAAYQYERERNRAPTTVTDLCAWLADQEAQRPASRSADAVTVATYHGSKGLEWPLVVLTDLDDESKASAFGVRVASDKSWSEIDWRNPLDGRWVRFWPWPLGAQRENVTLDASAVNSPEGRAAAQNERAERIRLIYVGATRARDYLILAVPPSTSGLPWLDELRADDGAPAIAIPAAGATSMSVNGQDHPVRVFEYGALTESPSAARPSVYTSPSVEAPSFLPLAIRPSAEAAAEDARIVEKVDLGARLPFSSSPDMNDVGEALHRFLAADDLTWDEERRIALAAGLLDAWGVTGFDPRDVVSMGSRFQQFVTSRWPDATVRREAPINWRVDGRTLAGRLDVVVEATDEIVVFDHKSFPGGRAQWIDQARKHGGQLRKYGEAVAATAEPRRPIRLAIHLPIGGEVLFVE
jgi:ATP-dependent exoDNAse (exonuclease V) beta subunit